MAFWCVKTDIKVSVSNIVESTGKYALILKMVTIY